MAKPNHQPFETWLLSDEPLTPEQNINLQAHLRACEACRQAEYAWIHVDRLLRSVNPLQPEAGFSLRWQQRLAAQRVRQQRRQSWLLFGGIAGMALVAIILLVLVLGWIMQTPAEIFFSLAYRMVVILDTFDPLVYVFNDAVQALTGVPLLSLFFFSGFVTLCCVLWLVAFQQLTTVRRVVL